MSENTAARLNLPAYIEAIVTAGLNAAPEAPQEDSELEAAPEVTSEAEAEDEIELAEADLLEEEAVAVVEEDEPQAAPGSEQAAPEHAALSSGDASGSGFEAGVKEMLRPMLREWLDENLPGIIENAVKDELGQRVGRDTS